MSSTHVWFKTKNIESLALYRKSSILVRTDFWPFIFLYGLCLIVYFYPQYPKDTVQSLLNEYLPEFANWNFQVYAWSLFGLWLVIIVAFFNLITGLLEYWHISIRAKMQYTRVHDIDDATVAHVVPPLHCGEDAIVKLETHPETDELYFMFQQMKYAFDNDTEQFVELDYPIDLKVAVYSTAKGLSNEQVEEVRLKYGKNEFNIPMPQFWEVFQEHATAPFFLFQIFCVGLWCLDEYWMYSMFTLFMLVVFEMMMVKRRMGNMKLVRNMRSKPFNIYVYRESRWHKMLSDELVPGDLISVSRSHTVGDDDDAVSAKEQTVVPCDLLLLHGSCVVDEALLTGESVPQIKEPIDVSNPEDTLDLKGAHKISLVSGGTKIVISSFRSTTEQSDDSKSSDDTSFASIRSPPDGGALAYVLKSGFNTSQGELLRTILFSTSRITVNNPEAFVFIGILLCFALGAASYVLYWGLQDETRNTYKLALNCVMIVTSVVPPELPMELSLAVNNSLIKLLKQKIFCTEAFRIPFAGGVEMCCFDKTGTLTSDSFQVVGCTKLNIDSKIIKQLTKPVTAHSQSNLKGSATSHSSDSSSPEKKHALELSNLLTANAKDFSFDSAMAIAGCHSLVSLDSTIIGDPLEKAALHNMGWSFSTNGVASPVTHNAAAVVAANRGNKDGRPDGPYVRIWHRFPFLSALKRMSCIVTIKRPNKNQLIRLVVKGAAETIGDRLANRPPNYDEVHRYFSRQGYRVLALAWRPLDDDDCNVSTQRLKDKKWLKSLKRNKFERNLIFSGFLIFACPHKPDSLDTILQLKASSNAVVMITGDHVLTACAVARDLHIATKPILSLEAVKRESSASAPPLQSNLDEEKSSDVEYRWYNLDEFHQDTGIPFDLKTPADVETVMQTYDLCLSGDSIKYLRQLHQSGKISEDVLDKIVICVRVYARTSPVQKEFILSTMKKLGLTTLMCGDGTNDVGALKQAHVGVAILSATAARAVQKQEQARIDAIKKKRESAMNRLPGMQQYQMKLAEQKRAEEEKKKAAEKRRREEEAAKLANPTSSQDLQKKMWTDLMNQLEDGGMEDNDFEAKPVALGDASIAAPFTSKLSTIESTLHIIRQGRCTLVITNQMYSILALNCLISAYSLSVLYLDGVKFGDTQMTVTGLMIAALFFFVTQGEPQTFLSAQQPHVSVFSPYMVLSLIGQMITHLGILRSAVVWSKPHTPTDEETRDPEGKFKPNVCNTVVFLVSTMEIVTVFAANYAGEPFMQSLRNNKKLNRTILLLCGVCFMCALNWMPEFNEYMQIAEMPSEEFRNDLIMLMIIDFVVSVGWERICRSMWRKKPNPLVAVDYPNEQLLKDAKKRHLAKLATEQKKVADAQSQNSPWAAMKQQYQMAQKMMEEQKRQQHQS